MPGRGLVYRRDRAGDDVAGEGGARQSVTSGDNDEEEAAWLDLIASYDAPVDVGGGSPWPERENLTKQDNAPIPGASQVTRSPQAPESPQTTGPLPGIRPPAPADPLSGPDQLDAPSGLDGAESNTVVLNGTMRKLS